MQDTTILFILLGIVTITAFASHIPAIMWAFKKGRNKVLVWYIGQDNAIQMESIKIGTDKSDLEIKLGNKSFIFDANRVYKMPNLPGPLSKQKCLFFTYKNCKPIDFHTWGSNQDKTPSELYSMLRTKMFQEIMAGPNDLLKGAVPFFVILIVGLGAYFIAKSQGWI